MNLLKSLVLTASTLVTGLSLSADFLDILNTVRQQDHASLKMMLDEGADVTQTHRLSLLEIAVHNRDTQTATMLLEAGFDVNRIERRAGTALNYSIINGDWPMFSLLMQYQPNIELRQREVPQATALMLAIWHNQKQMFNVLVAQGADIHAIDSLGDPVLSFAGYYGRTDMALQLIELGADIHFTGESSMTAVDKAVLMGHTQTATTLAKLLEGS